jgi:methyltransferase-like protein/SAM-dependent methyltransferase
MAGTHSTYDIVPYPRLSYAETHPDHLATLAVLLGLQPPPIEQCRVLELGCAGGDNLIPISYTLPGGEFMGVDASSVEIAVGQAAVQALHLDNVLLKHMDILDVTAGLGLFDYIIAHGIFSWVPRPVQDKILDICRQNLAPQGVAYVSYNTYPGSYVKAITRDAMLFHTRRMTDPQQRVHEAHRLTDLLGKAAGDHPLGGYWKAYSESPPDKMAEIVSEIESSVLLHDDLAEINEPIYFYQFMERASARGLQYLADANFQEAAPGRFAPEARKTLPQIAGDIIELEQYMDFLRLCGFRRTLLCHDDVAVQRQFTPAVARRFLWTSQARALTHEPDLRTRSVEKFGAPGCATLAIDHPLSKVAMAYLSEIWPQAASFTDLLATASGRLGLGAENLQMHAEVLAANLLQAYMSSSELAQPHTWAPPLAIEPGERPLASPIARYQAQTSNLVTNLWHERVLLENQPRYLLLLLDGSRDRRALVDHVANLAEQGIIAVKGDGVPAAGGDRVRTILAADVDAQLDWLAHSALLVRS